MAWDANPEPDVIGYKLYYKKNSSSLPFDGTGAAEGPSPIDVRDRLTQTLTGLSEGDIYYFAVSAYNSDGLESPLSAVVASDWVPDLFYPQAGEAVSPDEVVFSWSEAPVGEAVTYTLLYGTDPALPEGSLASHTSANSPLFAGAASVGLLGLLLVRRQLRPVFAACLLAGFLVTGCGGGGGSGSGSDESPVPVIQPGENPPPATGSPAAGTVTISGISGNTQSVRDLQPATTYYWKVVATDAQGNRRESAVGTFTTGQF